MGAITMPHPKDSWNLVGAGVQVKEAANADFRAADLVKVTAGLVDKFRSATAADAVGLAFINSDAYRYQMAPRKAWWPTDVVDQTYVGRGHIVYRMTDEDLMVFSLVGNAPADLNTLRGAKRNIAFDAAAGVALVQLGATSPVLEILDVIDGKAGELNIKLLCRPLMESGAWH